MGLAGATSALILYSAGADQFWQAGLWPDVLFLSLVLFPATLALIWIALPLRDHRATLSAGLTLAVVAVLFRLLELDVLFNVAKLFALALVGFWFLSWFENVMWAALIAVIIPWVDALSVWRGPTRKGLDDFPQVVDNVSIAFFVPGGGRSVLGPPDILFFALFLAAADRFGLRVRSTAVAMMGFLAATLIATVATDVIALPALPAICLGFLLPNADLLWTALRRQGRAPGRIYGRGSGERYDLDADVIERAPGRIVLLTRERPPRTAIVESGRLALEGVEIGEVEVHELENGVVVVPLGEPAHSVHPEQQAADEAKVERLIRERR